MPPIFHDTTIVFHNYSDKISLQFGKFSNNALFIKYLSECVILGLICTYD